MTQKNNSWLLRTSVSVAAVCAGLAGVSAQDATDSDKRQSGAAVLFEEIQVTATKKSRAENLQDVPAAITAYNADQLDALQVRSIESLSFNMPNVSLDDVGTTQGTANFSIRGLGINSSIPSIDPTVGVFYDGIYLGINLGTVYDVFDLEAVEVLRGPQGLLFGRNVTGGAVVLRTKKPSDELEITGKVAVESGLRGTGESYYAMGSVSGPIVEGKLNAKLAVYYNDDKGWHENLFDGSNVGDAETFVIRPALTFTPNERTELTVKYEHGDTEGHGPIAQNQGLFDRNGFDFSTDYTGLNDSEWDQLTAELNIDVDFGNGRITNVFGWRDLLSLGASDIDASSPDRLAFPANLFPFLFHATFYTEQDQISNELRYSGRFGDRVDITTGFYYFTQDISYNENRFLPPVGEPGPTGLPPGAELSGGGIQDHETWGAFMQADIDVTDKLTLTLGGRYTEEEKEVEVATLIFNTRAFTGSVNDGVCNVVAYNAPQCSFDFSVAAGDEARDKWTAFTPKVGLRYDVSDDAHVYAHWSRGFRSGGYNFRNGSAVFGPGPFDQEELDSYELGFKYTSDNRRVRLNGAFFLNDISDLQREINVEDPAVGVVQLIRNTADAEIFGFELEGQFLVTENLILTGNVGHLDGDYTEVRFDLNGDEAVNAADEELRIPRLAPWTYGFGFVYDKEIGNAGTLSFRANFNHRDGSPFTDNNRGILNSADMLDAAITWIMPDERFRLRAYGRNLLNEATHGGSTPLPFFAGATFAPLNKGNVFGLEFQFDL